MGFFVLSCLCRLCHQFIVGRPEENLGRHSSHITYLFWFMDRPVTDQELVWFSR